MMLGARTMKAERGIREAPRSSTRQDPRKRFRFFAPGWRIASRELAAHSPLPAKVFAKEKASRYRKTINMARRKNPSRSE